VNPESHPDNTLEIAVLRVEHNLLVQRVDREILLLEKLIYAMRESIVARDDGHAQLCDQRFEAFLVNHVKNHEREHETEQHAMELAMGALDHRLAGMNEFRRQIEESESRYATIDALGAVEAKLAVRDDTTGDRTRTLESAVVDIRAKLLGSEYAKSVDDRFRFLERMVYMASGALTIIVIVINFLRK
jgi:hypothetical protein